MPLRTLLLLTLIFTPLLGCSTPQPDSSFAVINGVKLHYLDWGGDGEALIFIAGTGDTAHAFDEMAPRFTDHFRVLALTRRGFGESDRPPTGYDIPTLTEDVRAILDDRDIDRANFVCHSAGGDEVTLFASTYPERTGKLVYLDAAYDRSGVRAIESLDPMGPDTPGSPEQALHWEAMHEFKPDFTRIKAPVLAFYATYPDTHWAVDDETPPDLAAEANRFMESTVHPYQQRTIERFRTEVPTARIIVLDDTHHYFFRDRQLRDSVIAVMRDFLIDPE